MPQQGRAARATSRFERSIGDELRVYASEGAASLQFGCELFSPMDLRRIWMRAFRDRYRAISEETELFEDPVAFAGKWANCNDDAIARALGEYNTLRWFKKPVGAPGKYHLIRDDATIIHALEHSGFFASVSTMEYSTQFALDTYG